MKNSIVGLKLFIVTTILTGLVYPLFITLIGQTVFNSSSNGRPDLIGQKFDQDKYFWSRPSAIEYNPLPSGGSNLSPTSQQLKNMVEERKQEGMPADLFYASASGLDPHISPAAAIFQVDRIVKVRGLDSTQKDAIIKLIDRLTEGRDWGVFGEPRINVLKLNQLIDNL